MTLLVKDAAGNDKNLKASGAGTTIDPFIMINQTDNNVPQQALVYKSLTLDGTDPVDITNRNMANSDGSVTPVRYRVGPPAGQIWQLTGMIFLLRAGDLDSGGWGDSTTPLPNGMTVGLNLDGTEYDFTPVPWTTHADLAGVAHDLTNHSWGAGDEFITMRLTFAKAGQNIRLVGDNGDYFWMDVNDDLTSGARGIDEQRVMIQGFIEGVYL